MKVGRANESIIIISQTNDSPVGITTSIIAPGIISNVVFLDLYDCHVNNIPFTVDNLGHLKSELRHAEDESIN